MGSHPDDQRAVMAKRPDKAARAAVENLAPTARISLRDGVARTYAGFLADQAAGTLRS